MIALALLFALDAVTPAPACAEATFEEIAYTACVFDPAVHDIRLFLNGPDGEPYGHFGPLAADLAREGLRLVFAMNAGMYRRDRSPVGLYVEDGADLRGISTKDGPGNFHMKPNGVFVIDENGRAAVLATPAYVARVGDAQEKPRYATQSGPMLVIDGAVHPRFIPGSDSLKRRNGVGVRDDGRVVFAISDAPVNFETFARLFRDALACPNALYLDGTISRLYAPEIRRQEPGVAMGPIVGVVAPSD